MLESLPRAHESLGSIPRNATLPCQIIGCPVLWSACLGHLPSYDLATCFSLCFSGVSLPCSRHPCTTTLPCMTFPACGIFSPLESCDKVEGNVPTPTAAECAHQSQLPSRLILALDPSIPFSLLAECRCDVHSFIKCLQPPAHPRPLQVTVARSSALVSRLQVCVL